MKIAVTQRLNTYFRRIGFIVTVGLVLLFSFQNCGQPGEIYLKSESEEKVQAEGEVILPGFAVKDLSRADNPPLKLVFVMDNSRSMALSNLTLKQSISAMFDDYADNISQFDTDIYFVSTAQNTEMARPFFTKLKSPGDFVSLSPSAIESTHRGASISGIIAGDLLGFNVNTTTTEDAIRTQYKAQPVVSFDMVSGGSKVVAAVRYEKGTSIQDLKNKIAQRLDVLDPDKASNIQEASLFKALDTESGLCAASRILKYPEGIINPGDIASFIIVSDENESDPTGAGCLAENRRDYLYETSCSKTIASYNRPWLQVQYMRPGNQARMKTTFEVTPPDRVLNKIVTTINLKRDATAADCRGNFDKKFQANYSYRTYTKLYRINYTKWAKIGDREGDNGAVYSNTPQTGSKDVAGVLPSDCKTNIVLLRTQLGDSTSRLEIGSCLDVSTEATTTKSTVYDFASYPSVVSPSTTCPDSLKSAIQTQVSATLLSCSIARKAEAIPASSLSGATSVDSCKHLVSQVCSQSSSDYRQCTYVSFAAAIAAKNIGPHTATENAALSCSSPCSSFPSLCSGTQTVSAYTTSLNDGLKCIATTANSTVTYQQAQAVRTVAVEHALNVALSCNSACNVASAACNNSSSSSVTVASTNKACAVKKVEEVAATTPTLTDLGSKIYDSANLSCNSLCSAIPSVCTGRSSSSQAVTTIAQHVTSLGGSSCSEQRGTDVVPASVDVKKFKTKLADAKPELCAAGYLAGNPVKLSEYQDSAVLMSTAGSLADDLENRLKTVVGEEGSSFSAFITLEGQGDAAKATSFGAVYKNLVNRLGRGEVSDVKAPSYQAALVNLSAILKSQLLRSTQFPEVMSHQKIYRVWKKARGATDWGTPLASNLWSSSGGTVTLNASVILDLDDQIKIEYY